MDEPILTGAPEPTATPPAPTPDIPMPTYFGSRKVSSWGKGQVFSENAADGLVSTGLVWVMYEDGGREVMREEEWALHSIQPIEENLDFDKKRMSPMVGEMLALVNKYNVRLEDLGLAFRMVIDTLQLSVNQAKEVALGQPAWMLRVDDIQKVLDDGLAAGKKPQFTDIIRQVQGTVIQT